MTRLAIVLFMLFFVGCQSSDQSIPTSGYIPAGHLKVYYEQTGKGEPLLFLHAGLMDHTMWEKQVKFFSKDHLVTTIDLPGHGNTHGIDSTILIADVIRICLDSLHINKTTVIG